MKKSELFYVGGYKGKDSQCLHLCEYRTQEAAIEILESYEIDNASYLCFSHDRQYLYTVIEVGNYKGHLGGGVAAYAIEKDGMLRFINEVFSEGADPCHLSVSPDGKNLYVANYSGGSTIIFELLPTGGIGEKNRLIEHKNFGPASRTVPGRQEAPHAHYIQALCVNGALSLWACDLGIDTMLVMSEAGEELARFKAPDGFGPRHLAFHPSLQKVYLVGEMSCSVIAFEYSFDTEFRLGASKEVPVLSSEIKSTCAAIRVSPDGNYLLVSNREEGEGSVSVLGLDSAGEIIGLEGVVPIAGHCPRDFVFSPAGDKVFVANQDSDMISVFDWSNTASLTASKVALKIQKPTCILFQI